MAEEKHRLVLDSKETYMDSSLKALKKKMRDFFDDAKDLEVTHILENLHDINAYENLEHLKPLKKEHVTILDEEKIDTSPAEQAVLEGKVIWEHAAAGEATRLGLGTKYIIRLDKLETKDILEMIKRELKKDLRDDAKKLKKHLDELTPEKLETQMGGSPKTLLPMSLGTRHMLQLAFDIKKLAERYDKDPKSVLAKQKIMMILNEQTHEKIVNDFLRFDFFGFDRRNVFFLIQSSFHGIDIKEGEPFYDTEHENHKRLHNHGQIAMQKTYQEAVFWIDKQDSRTNLTSEEFENILERADDLISYNIEDMPYLTGSIDMHSIALALELGKQGYGMVMEIVGQNPLKPQKGGACFWDAKKERAVIIESNQLKGLKPEDIQHLNKNFNHYTNPVISFREVKKGKLPLHIDVKKMKDRKGDEKEYIYFCTPQGDINFLVKTAYVMRSELKPIAHWKSPATTPQMIKACRDQDVQNGFREFAENITGQKF